MSWDPIWESIFQSRDWGKYPPEELVRFVARNFFSVSVRKEIKILELGCGTGANIWFLSREGFDAYGIDGSPTAIKKAEIRLEIEGVSAHFEVGDIKNSFDYYLPGTFDAVIDVACLWCNRLGDVDAVLRDVNTLLKPDGKIFSMMLASGSLGDGLGKEIEPGTFQDIEDGPLKGAGVNHFFTIAEIRQLFVTFTDVQVEYSIRSLNNQKQIFKLWIIEGRKNIQI